MSLQYDEYLKEHIQNVTNGLRWIADNLDLRKLGIFESDIHAALENAGEHDRSKYDVIEYRAYDDYFYGGNKSHAVKTAFDQAWLHHQHANPHHWQYWVLINDGDGVKPLPMPADYILEMIADWWSFSWREGNLMGIFDWYDKHRDVILFEDETRKIVESILAEMRKVLEMQQKHENGYVGEAEEDHLEHHGILGQKWGQRNGPPYPLKEGDHSKNEQKLQGLQNLNGAKTANIEKWGNDPNHNVLYIAGYSGSGKSTAALALKKPGDSVIHLDVYTEPDNADDNSGYQDKEFNKYLDKHVPNWTALQKATKDGEGVYKRHSKEYWKVVDQFDKAIDSFSKEKYKNGERVIVEGVQIADNWLKGANEDYAGKPMAILQNGPIKSMSRAFERDDRGNLFQGLKSLDDAKEYAGWYYQMTKNLNGLANATGAKKKAYEFDDDLSHSEAEDDYLEHHGILGQKWGVRRYQNADGSLTEEGKKHYRKTVFVSGSSKTQTEDSPYYRKELPSGIRKELDKHMEKHDRILVGDAPGIDRQVQDYLNEKNYDVVEVYGPGKQVRYSANSSWKTKPIDAPEYEEGSKEWLAKKDIAMSKEADEGLAVILDEGANATRWNVQRMRDDDKDVKVYQLNQNGIDLDRWLMQRELKDVIIHSEHVIGKVVDTRETENGLEVTVEHSEPEDNEDLYGVPEQKKFPLPDADHVRSAIRFFNWVDPKYEKGLAKAILEKMNEYGMSFDDFGVGDENRFKKYIPEEDLKDNEEKSK